MENTKESSGIFKECTNINNNIADRVQNNCYNQR